MLHFRGGRKLISKAVYPDLEEFYLDLGKTYRKAVKAFYDAGCRYLQFDDTVWAYLCSQDELQKSRARGDNPDGLQEIYARIINYAIAERPADMVITTHVCRGNFRSTWISSGGYEPVAETMLAGTNYDGYFLEYDSDRAGGFEPLRYLPKGNKIVVVGIITSKTGDAGEKGRYQAPAGRGRRNSSPWTSSRCRRNAALPPPKRATSSPRKSSGRNCGSPSKSPTRCGGSKPSSPAMRAGRVL